MFCPGCGNENSIEQRFCRVCGLELTDASRSVKAQMPADAQAAELAERTRGVENALVAIGAIFLVGFDAFMIWKIITAIIIGKGQLLGGILGILAVVVLSMALCLVVYRQFLLDATTRRAPRETLRNDIPELGPGETRRLTDPYFEPAQSVVDRTTELLKNKNL